MGICKNFSIKLSIIITVFIVISLSGCFSEWNGGNANLTIYLGGGADRAAFYPDSDTLSRLTYVIDFSGPSTFKIGPTEPGKSAVSVSLFPGKWNITVTAYDGEKVYAIGKATVEARAGQNVSKIITLSLEWVTFDSIEAFRAWLGVQPNNTETAPYRVKLNVSTLGGNIIDDNSLVTVLNANANKYVKLDLSGSNLLTIEEEAFFTCATLTSITIPASVTSIGNDAFYCCTSLTSITIPASVTSIGNKAFYCCTSLTSVTIPASVTSIGDEAFRDCPSLTSVTFAKGGISIGNNAFPEETNGNGGNALKTAYITGGAGTYMREKGGATWSKAVVFESIKDFRTWLDKQESYELPSGSVIAPINSYKVKLNVKSLGGNSSNAESVGNVLLSNPKKLVNLDLSGSTFNSIVEKAFSDCKYLYSVTIPNSVTRIEASAFQECENLCSVTIPNSVTYIGIRAFENTGSLNNNDVIIPYSVQTIEEYAFIHSSLENLTIGSGVNKIKEFAFNNCGYLQTVTFRKANTIIDGDYVFIDGPNTANLKAAYTGVGGGIGTYIRNIGTNTWTKSQ